MMPLNVAEGNARLDLRAQIEPRGRGTGQIDKVIFSAHGINAREHKAAAEKDGYARRVFRLNDAAEIVPANALLRLDRKSVV